MMLQNQGKLKEVEPVLQRALTSEEMHASQNVDDVAVYCFGDSQAEVLDYVFHKDPRYRTWHDRRVGWRSGWSARGLYTKANMQRILVPVSECHAKNALVYLTFGSTDIDINLPYKRFRKGQHNLNVDVFLEEMTTNLWNVVLQLHAMNLDPAVNTKVHVCLVFPYVPSPTTTAYWNRVFGNDPAPHQERMDMYESFIERLCERGRHETAMEVNILGSSGCGVKEVHGSTSSTGCGNSDTSVVHILNVQEDYKRAGFDAFQRKIVIAGRSFAQVDHHPDFIATQAIVAEKIRELHVQMTFGFDMLHPPLRKMYPHVERDLRNYSVIPRHDFYLSNMSEENNNNNNNNRQNNRNGRGRGRGRANTLTITDSVPQEHVGRIIGKKGSQIKYIEKQSGCKVRVKGKRGHQTVTYNGTIEQIHQAQFLVQKCQDKER